MENLMVFGIGIVVGYAIGEYYTKKTIAEKEGWRSADDMRSVSLDDIQFKDKDGQVFNGIYNCKRDCWFSENNDGYRTAVPDVIAWRYNVGSDQESK